MTIGLSHYLAVAAILFTIGVFGIDIGSIDAPNVIAAGSTEKYGRVAIPSAFDRSASWTTTAG